MPNVDTLTRMYLSHNDRFAELFNTFVFKGEHVVNQDALRAEIPIEEVYNPEKRKSVKKDRDLLKVLNMVTDGELNYLLLGVENQLGIHYAMPVRTMIYDSLQYGQQIQKRTAAQESSSFKSGNEFLSGFGREQKLIPVITLVVYWGKGKWDGPLSLKEMFEPTFLNRYSDCIQDYRLNLLDLNDVPDSVMDKLETDLKKVLYFRKYSDDKEKLKELIRTEHSMYRCVARDAAFLMRELTNAGFEIPEGDTVDMCKAIAAMIQEKADEVKAEVETRAREEIARAKKEAANAKKETAEAKAKTLRSAFQMMSKYDQTLSQDEICRMVADNFQTTVDEVRQAIAS